MSRLLLIIKLHFTSCGERSNIKIWSNIKKSQNIMTIFPPSQFAITFLAIVFIIGYLFYFWQVFCNSAIKNFWSSSVAYSSIPYVKKMDSVLNCAEQ